MGITRKTAYLLLGGVPAIGLGALAGAPWALFWWYDIAVAALFLVDWFRAPRKSDISVSRSWEGSFELCRESNVTLAVSNRISRKLALRLCDAPPDSFDRARIPLNADCAPGAQVCVQYAVRPTQRGAFRFGGCHAEARGPMGLCVRRFVLPCETSEAPVYPDLGPMRKYRLLASRRQLHRDDRSAHRVRGVGSEFVGIREYSPDDDTRKINWMATARAGKPLTNIYDVERNRNVLLALDIGRWMDAPLGPVTRLDRAAELCAALAQTAISSGDRVGLILYDAEVRAYLKPERGHAQMNKVLSLLYKARSSRHESSLSAMAAHASRRIRHRGLVCVFSYLDGRDAAAAASASLWTLSRRHAVLFASLSDPVLRRLADSRAADLPQLYLKASAIHRGLSERDAVHRLRTGGLHCLSDEPARLLSQMVRQYMNFKRKVGY